MTPDCSTCGYAVDWARSCHRGVWHLFRNRPDVETAGRFCFVSDETPFYPGFHNVWSMDWTEDREDQTPPAVLGEDRYQRLGYSKGALGVSVPPAALIGTEDCVEFGEQAYPPQGGRTLVAGIDGRCWSDAGIPVPAVVPILWLQSSQFDGKPAGFFLRLMKDRSVYTNDGKQSNPALYPVVNHEQAYTAVATSTNAYFVEDRTVRAGLEWSAFVVAYIPSAGFGHPPAASWLVNDTGSQVGIRVSFLTVATVLGGFSLSVPTSGNFDALHLWSARMQGGTLSLYRDGLLLTSAAAEAAGPLLIKFPLALAVYGPISQAVQNMEVKVFGPGLTDAAFATEQAALLAAYRIGDDVLTGTIVEFAAGFVPGGYLACDGSAVSRTAFADLFAIIGTTWGVGDGSTTFNVPDLRGRSPLGSGSGPGLTPRTLAAKGGEETHLLTTAESPAHNHVVNDPGHSHGSPMGGSNGFIDTDGAEFDYAAGVDLRGLNQVGIDVTTAGSSTGISLNPSGGGGSHNNMSPFAVVQYLIKT